MEEKKERFEDLLKNVEEAVRGLESGRLGLEESLEKYEAGMNALRRCYEILEKAEKKIQLLVKERDGSLAEKDFESPPKKKKRAKEDEVPF